MLTRCPEIFNLVFKDGDLKLQETGENAESLNTFTVVTKELPKDDKTYVLAFGKRQQPDDPEDLGPVHACAAVSVPTLCILFPFPACFRY